MIKVAAFLRGMQLFCVKTSDIQGLYALSAITENFENNPSFTFTCYNSLLNQSSHLFNWDQSQNFKQACFLLEYAIALPFEKLVGVFEIEKLNTESIAHESNELFNLLPNEAIGYNEENLPVHLFNAHALPDKFKKIIPTETKTQCSTTQNHAEAKDKKLILKSRFSTLSVDYSSVLKVLYRPQFIQKYPVKSAVLGQFKEAEVYYESLCFDKTNEIYDFHIFLEHSGHYYTINCKSYEVVENELTQQEQEQWEEFITKQPITSKTKCEKNESSIILSTSGEDYIFYKNSMGTCAVEAKKVVKIVLSAENSFDVLLQGGEVVKTREVIGMLKAQLKACPGLINNQIVVTDTASAFYPHA